MMSRCSTILIHSRTTDIDGKSVERFIGSQSRRLLQRRRVRVHRPPLRRALGEREVIDPLEGAQANEAIRTFYSDLRA